MLTRWNKVLCAKITCDYVLLIFCWAFSKRKRWNIKLSNVRKWINSAWTVIDMSKSEKSRETEKNESRFNSTKINSFRLWRKQVKLAAERPLSCLSACIKQVTLYHWTGVDVCRIYSSSSACLCFFFCFFAGLVWLRGCPMRWGSGWVRRCASMTALQRYEITLLFNTSTFVSQKQRYKSCNRGSAFLKVTLLYILFYL